MPNGKTVEEAEKQIAALVEDNKRLAAEVDGLQTDGAMLEKAARGALTAKTAAEHESANAKAKLEVAQQQVAKLQQANTALTAQAARLNRQIEKNPLTPLTVEEAVALFEGLLTPFRASKTLEIRQVTLSLKLATGKIGDVPVILVPDPKSADPALLHEIKLDLTSRPSDDGFAPVTPVAECRLTIRVAGPGTVAANPASKDGRYPCGTIVSLTATPAPGATFQGYGGAATGSNPTVAVLLDDAKTVTAAFAQPPGVTLTVATNPSGLVARIGTSGAFTPAPLTQEVPAGQTQTVSVSDPQVVNGTGFRFSGWSTGGSTATTTVEPSGNITATASFRAACHAVTVTVAGSGGTVALSPATGALAGFPADCYAPGAQVRILANADPGFGIKAVSITTGGTTQAVTTANTPVIVNSPITATVTYVPRPATISTIFPPVAAGAVNQSNVFFANPTPTPGSNLRITEVTFQTSGGAGTVTLVSTLPAVFGNLPANGQSSTLQLVYKIPASVTTFNILVTVEVSNANGDVFTNQVSIGHSRPR